MSRRCRPKSPAILVRTYGATCSASPGEWLAIMLEHEVTYRRQKGGTTRNAKYYALSRQPLRRRHRGPVTPDDCAHGVLAEPEFAANQAVTAFPDVKDVSETVCLEGVLGPRGAVS